MKRKKAKKEKVSRMVEEIIDEDFLAKNIGDCKLCRFGLECMKITKVIKEIPGAVFRCPIVIREIPSMEELSEKVELKPK